MSDDNQLTKEISIILVQELGFAESKLVKDQKSDLFILLGIFLISILNLFLISTINGHCQEYFPVESPMSFLILNCRRMNLFALKTQTWACLITRADYIVKVRHNFSTALSFSRILGDASSRSGIG